MKALANPVVLSVVCVVLAALLGFLATTYWRYRTRMEAIKSRLEIEKGELLARVTANETAIAVMQTQISPFWAGVQAVIADGLKHPHEQFHEADELLKELEGETITSYGMTRLRLLLTERVTSDDPNVSPGEKISAEIMLLVMQKKIEESAMLLPDAGRKLT